MKNKNIRILLMTPNFIEKWNKLDLVCKENLALLSLSAFLKKEGFNVVMENAQLEGKSNTEILKNLKHTKFDLIGVSCSSQKLYVSSRDFIIRAKKQYPDAYIVMGGVFPTLSYADILEDIKELDAVSLGEGEFSLLKICEKIGKGNKDFSEISGIAYRGEHGLIVNNPDRIKDLDALPFPDRDPKGFGRNEGVTAYMIAGKGCYGNCSYCSIQSCFNYHNRICRSAKNVVDEIEKLINDYGVTHIQFHDDIFYNYSRNSQKWLYEFIDEVKKRNIEFTFRIYLRPNDIQEKEIKQLKEIGLNTVFIGAESGVQRILDEMNKHITPQQILEAISVLKKCKIDIDLGFITLVPTMSFEELEENYNFLFNLGSDVYSDANLHNRLNIYNGCEYEQILDKQNLLKPKENFWDIHSYNFADAKVQKFHDILQSVKNQAKHTKVLENRIVLKYKNNPEQVKKIRKIGVEHWTSIIKELIRMVKVDCINFNKICEMIACFEKEYETIIKQI